MKKRKFVLFFALCLTACVLITFVCDAFLPIREEEIFGSIIRLHVIAESDSEEDQAVKLLVRDGIIRNAPGIFDGCNIDEACAIASSSCGELKEIADKILEENGFDYRSEVVFSSEDYPTREYDGITFPAGKYLSVRVKLGKAEGHNWWCVLFPPLCLGASTVISKTSKSVSKAYSVNTVKHKIEAFWNMQNYRVLTECMMITKLLD